MVLGVVPFPRSLSTRAGVFTLSPEVVLTGDAEVASVIADLVLARTGVRLRVAVAVAVAAASGRTIAVRRTGTGAPEGYRLRVDPGGVALESPDAAGLFYGAQTLVQLLSHNDAGGWDLPAADISDAPRFAHRGMMLDVARHFFPVPVVERLIDRIAALKLNVLHLHLSDDQGWRLALQSRPALAHRGSQTSALGDPGGHFTGADYAHLVAYAAARHVRVVPEVDLPGHTHAVGLAYPELVEPPVISASVAETAATFGGGIPTPGEPYTGFAVGFSSLRIRDEATYKFLADVLGEIAALTPGPLLHIGGDEALGTSAEDYAYFLTRATEIVAGLGKTPVAWHEAGRVAGIAPGTIGQYWGFVTPIDGADEDARGFIAGDGRLILSPADAIYLDMKPDAQSALGLEWANGPTSLEAAYSWEPTRVIARASDRDILGVEAALWTETLATEADIEAMVFPRIAAAAEIAWSAADGPERTWPAFRERVAVLAELWADAGIRAGRIASPPPVAGAEADSDPAGSASPAESAAGSAP
ncbi:beta-N-acetylhexosaminidase [Microbacterium sp. cx-59]|uniref:beta-N-acetylhexosaminidase n=1 Tax=Microbacterium sp. cx-59 TaxID=2891207 RepID=UPI001E57A553|nr:beta-N-acetylhexosaminidase [Microbacterium sp. cx-59]MCC4907938.1 beta-N-acetylhexosaminidase [Microbacterium sp. cx-59]